MSFIFSMRSTPKANKMPRLEPSSPTIAAASLPAIEEDGDLFLAPRTPPPVPPRALNRPEHKGFALGAPPLLSDEASPPPYSRSDEGVSPSVSPKGEKLAEAKRAVKENKQIAKRGGWKRLVLLALLVVLCLVGLIVGLVVGLRKRGKSTSAKESNAPASSASSPESNTTSVFPAGSYRFTTHLTTITTNCTSAAATWRCYPYFTSSQSPSQSTAVFDWVISPSSSPNGRNKSNIYTISSTPNPFAITFANATLTLQNAGAPDEHYAFQTAGMRKPTNPVGQLGVNNVAASCAFNQTVLRGTLYTKRPATLNGTNAQGAWPFAVEIAQEAPGGPGTPTCVDPAGNSLGDFSVPDQSQSCECLYTNTGT